MVLREQISGPGTWVPEFANGAVTGAFVQAFNHEGDHGDKELGRKLESDEEIADAYGVKGKDVIVSGYRDLTGADISGYDSDQIADLSQSGVHEEIVVVHAEGNVEHFGFRQGGVVPDPQWSKSLDQGGYTFGAHSTVVNAGHALGIVRAVAVQPRFAMPGSYNLATNNCQTFATAVYGQVIVDQRSPR